jgi:hypothetical protein
VVLPGTPPVLVGILAVRLFRNRFAGCRSAPVGWRP